MKEKEMIKILKALANRRRFMILKILKKEGEKSVGNLSSSLKLSFKSTSKHLRKLVDAGLVTTRQVSNIVFYSLDKDNLEIVNFLFRKLQ